MQFDSLVTITFIIIAVVYVQIIALALFRKEMRLRVERWLMLYLAVMVLWQLIRVMQQQQWFDTAVTDLLARLVWFGLPLMALLFYFLSHIFLRRPMAPKRWLVVSWLWLFASLAVDFLPIEMPIEMPISLPPAWAVTLDELVNGLWLATWGAVVVGTAVLIFRAYQGAKRRPLHRNRIRYWALALLVAIARDLFVFAGHDALSSVFHLLVTLLIAYAMLTHRLLDVRQVMRRVISYLLVIFFIAFVFLAGLQPVRPYLENLPGYNPSLNGAALALILLLLFEPSHKLAQRLVEKLTAGQEYNPEHTLRQYSSSISNIVDLADLEAMVVRLISEAMDITYGTLYLVDEAPGRGDLPVYELSSVQGAGDARFVLGAFAVGSPVAAALGDEKRPLTQYDIDLLPEFNSVSADEHEWLISLGMEVYVPINAKGKWIGLLGLGPKNSGDQYYEHDLELLGTLADQTAIALENARLVSDLVQLNRELKQATAKYEQANRLLQESDKLKSAFIGVVTHELGTPFANIGFSLELLARYGRDNLTPDQAEQIDQLTAGVATAKAMVDNLVKFATFVNKQGELRRESFDFAELVTEALTPLRPFAQSKELIINRENGSGGQNVTADRELVSEAIHHLLHNAFKFTEEGGKVWIRAWDENGRVCFEVQDNGIGIPQEKQAEIWGGFVQMADPLRRGHEGLGLGLPLVKQIIEAHDGQVYAQSREHVGSIFGFKLPAGE